MMRRRDLLQTVGVGWLMDQMLPDHPHIRGRLVGASHRVGHRLRSGPPSGDPARTERADVVVVGSGVSGLTATWRLEQAGLRCLGLELEPFVGGTSTWGEDGVVPHPWGAHYLPAPEPEAKPVARLLQTLGVITGWDAAGRPRFAAHHLCHAPEERLFYDGRWHGGLIPWDALSAQERNEMTRFMALGQDWTLRRGRDGKRAFTIPLTAASRDPEIVALDRMSMAAWLDDKKLFSPFLRWFVEYGTRDDFGANLDQTSAWAGLHYFAARVLETEQLEGGRYLVWPEGNGWLVRQITALLQSERRHGALVMRVAPARDGVTVDYLDVGTEELVRIEAKAAVLAIPGFVTRRVAGEVIAPGARLPVRASSPWLVANLHVRRPLEPNRAWDSMIYDSPGLGYVDAGHQRAAPRHRSVWTYFRAFGEADVAGRRAQLVGLEWADLASMVLRDLTTAHPELPDQTTRIDVMVWGHAMPRPQPGFLGEDPMASAPLIGERVAWAHVDQTGYALFEEATDRGVRAAEALLEPLGVSLGESWV